jgi:glycosyltransferase involved in cell wall biosynthesis
MKRALQVAVFELRAARWAIGLFLLCRGTLLLRAGRLYRGLDDLCWVVRVPRIGWLRRLAGPRVLEWAPKLRASAVNPLVTSFNATRASAAVASVYSLVGPGTHDLFRDLIVLKRATPDEKGVILLKYARTFDGVVALFDLPRLMERYLFVLEPCWAGYCHPSTLLYLTPGEPVFIQCFTEEDHRFVCDVGPPFVPVRLGPADWVDADVFRPPPAVFKRYDVVMVANWSPEKRHTQLFRALERITDRDIRVLLIGFPWANRTASDVRRDAGRIRNPRVVFEVLENVPQSELASLVSQCKVLVFLTKKEGDNKAVVEAMFANVPAIVYDKTIGGASSRINASTGILSSDEALSENIRFMLDHYPEFSPRTWVLEHSGSAAATLVLNQIIEETVLRAGGRYTEDIIEKTNSPNLAYKDPASRTRFRADYEFILRCRRGSDAVKGRAVA